MPKPPRKLGSKLAPLSVEDVGAAVLDGDASRSEPVLTVMVELCFALGRPPESDERFAQLEAPLLNSDADHAAARPTDVNRRERP